MAGVIYTIQIQTANIGNAIKNSAYLYNFIPLITSITPNIGKITYFFYFDKYIFIYVKGSSNGGTSVQISGDGFLVDRTIVSLSGISYSKSNSNISYSNVSLITSSSSVGSNSISIYVNGVLAICSSNCNYQFSTNVAPTISSISPTSVSSLSIMSITGTQFGTDKTKLTVTIGNNNCNMINATANLITCSLNSLYVGQHSVVVNLKGIRFFFL